MTFLSRARDALGLWPDPNDVEAVARMTAHQWRRAARTKPSYLQGYRDRPGSPDRAQRRAEWIASLPIFERAASVTEVGCGCGRTLAALARRHPHLALSGVDISTEALAVAERTLAGMRHSGALRGAFTCVDLYDLSRDHVAADAVPAADVILTVGVLGHLHPQVSVEVMRHLRARARTALVMVEEFGAGEVLKGPRPWTPEQVTDDYALWRVPLNVPDTAAITRFPVPADLQAPAAKEVVIWR